MTTGYVIKHRGDDYHVISYLRTRDEAYWDTRAMNEHYQTDEYYFEEYDGARSWFESIRARINNIREEEVYDD